MPVFRNGQAVGLGDVNIFDGVGNALTSTLVGADQSLDVNITGGAGAGGTSMTDDAAFTPGATAITPAGAMFDDAAPDSVDEGDGGVVRMSANRNLYTTIRDAAGNERGLNIAADNTLGINDSGNDISIDDGGGSVTVDDGGVSLAVDDGGGSITVDDGGVALEIEGTLTGITNDVNIADGGNTITVDGTVSIGAALPAGANNIGDVDVLSVPAPLNVVGGGAEAAAQRVTLANDSTGVLTVDDGGGSFTVDNAALSVVGGGVEATAQRVTIANDSTGLLSVDDGGGALTIDGTLTGVTNDVSIDDGGNSITVDNAALSVVGGGVEAAALRVTVANDSTGLLSVDDAGGSLTVDNAALSVVGGGAEATALRVTIANDSTGVVTVDDGGGALTVDGTVTAANAAGDVADDAADSGNPVKIGGVAVETDGSDPTSVTAEGDRAELRTTLDRLLLISDTHPYSWSNNSNWAAAQTDTAIQAAPGANLSLYITDVEISVDGAASVKLVRNTAGSTDVFGPFYFSANGGMVKRFKTPIRLPANENLGVTSTGAVNCTVSTQGYTAP